MDFRKFRNWVEEFLTRITDSSLAASGHRITPSVTYRGIFPETP